jgi:hypothetical protein
MTAIDLYGVLVLHISAELGRAASAVFLRMGVGFDIEFLGFLCHVAFSGVCSDQVG